MTLSLSNKDKKILAEIISLGGQCLESKRCIECPFRSVCLPEFLNPYPLTRPQRLNMALDVISYGLLLDDELNLPEVQSYYGSQKETSNK